jgi:hypothetical protein
MRKLIFVFLVSLILITTSLVVFILNFDLFESKNQSFNMEDITPVYGTNYKVGINYVKSDASIESYVQIFLLKDNSEETKLIQSFERFNKVEEKWLKKHYLYLILNDTIRNIKSDTNIIRLPSKF